MADLSKPHCARCGHEGITYKDGDKTHIVLPFAIPADAPLDDESMAMYVTSFGAVIVEALDRLRKERGYRPSIIVAPNGGSLLMH